MSPEYDAPFYDEINVDSLAAAQKVLPFLFKYSGTPKTMVDVGCGEGTWLAAAQHLGVETVHGIDGHHVDPQRLLIPAQNYQPLDLEKVEKYQPTGLQPFDLAISLEVAEHLDIATAASFVNFLCSLSDLVLFSAAIPRQTGVHHVNEQWPQYWAEIFTMCGYKVTGKFRMMLWEDQTIAYYYRQNVLVCASAERLERDAGLRKLWNVDLDFSLMRFVHPDLFRSARP